MEIVEDTNTEESKEEEIEQSPPEFVAGIIINLLPDGKGTVFHPIVDETRYARQATGEDVICMLNHCLVYIQANLTTGKVLANLANLRDFRRAAGKLGIQ